jgi:hypothetical protein
MLYGPAKRRQMARSILPSRARKDARADLRLVHRSHRRAVAQKLRANTRITGIDPDDLFDLGDQTRYPNHKIRVIVLNRRFADTLNHFERWAVAATRHLPVQDRLPVLRSWLPDGLIGAHAESHLLLLPAIHPPAEHDPHWYALTCSIEHERDVTRAALHRALDTGLHGELNHQLRHVYGERLLLGIHDVDAFINQVVRCGHYRCGRYCDHPALDSLRHFISHHGLAGCDTNPPT